MTRRISVAMCLFEECSSKVDEKQDYDEFDRHLRRKGIIKKCEEVYGIAYTDSVSYVVLDVGCRLD